MNPCSALPHHRFIAEIMLTQAEQGSTNKCLQAVPPVQEGSITSCLMLSPYPIIPRILQEILATTSMKKFHMVRLFNLSFYHNTKKIMAISGVSIFFLIVLSIIAFVLTLIGTFSFAFPFLILLKKKTRETSWFYGGE